MDAAFIEAVEQTLVRRVRGTVDDEFGEQAPAVGSERGFDCGLVEEFIPAGYAVTLAGYRVYRHTLGLQAFHLAPHGRARNAETRGDGLAGVGLAVGQALE